MAEKPIPIEDFAPEESDAVKKWSDNLNDFDIGHLYNALGYAPGHGGYRPKADLEPSFLDKIGQHFGVQTAKMKERQDLIQKQHELKPLVSALVADKIHRIATLRAAPQNVGEAPEMDKMLGLGGGPVANSLQAAPSMGGDPAMVGMPMGASSANAAAMPQLTPPDTAMPQPLSDGGRFMTPDAAMTTPMVDRSAPQQFDEQGRPLAAPTQLGLIEQPIRPEPIASPMARAPQAAPPPQALPEWRRHQYAAGLHAQATGHLVPGANGGLVPYHPDAQLLNAPQQQELSDIFAGGKPTGKVPLPAAPLMQALKGKTESKAQEITAPVREYMKSHKLDPNIPEHVEMARQGIRGEKQGDEKAQIAYKEALQMSSKDVNDELLAMGIRSPLDATADQVEQAIKNSVDRKVSKHARELTDTFNASAIDATEKEKLTGLQQIVRVTNRIRSEFSPEERREFVGKLDNPKEKLKQFFLENPRFAQFDALINREMVAAFETGGKALTAQEAAIIFGFLPTAKEWSPANFEAKLREADDYAKSKMRTIVDLATSNRQNLAKRVETALDKDSSAAGPKQIKSDEDYNKLPSGTLFISPDGKTRRKP